MTLQLGFPLVFQTDVLEKNIQHPDSLVLYLSQNVIQEDLTLKVFPSVESHKHWLLVLLRVISTFFLAVPPAACGVLVP